jgi:hypothetical protein
MTNLSFLKSKKVILGGFAVMLVLGGVSGFALTQNQTVQSQTQQIDMTQYVQKTDFDNYKAVTDQTIADLQTKLTSLEEKSVNINLSTSTPDTTQTTKSVSSNSNPTKRVTTTPAPTVATVPAYTLLQAIETFGPLHWGCSQTTTHIICGNSQRTNAFAYNKSENTWFINRSPEGGKWNEPATYEEVVKFANEHKSF